MTRIDARLLLGLRGTDLIATTARLALVEKMGFGGGELSLSVGQTQRREYCRQVTSPELKHP